MRIWPHNRLKNHLVLLLVWVRISPTSDPIFLLAPLFFNSFSKSRRKHTSSATQSSWWWWENPANSEVHFASNSSVYYFCIFSIFSQTFFFLLFLASQWLKTTLKSLILQHCNLRNLVEKRVRNTNCIRMCELYSVKYDILARKFIYIL